jgi:hypothetical protein
MTIIDRLTGMRRPRAGTAPASLVNLQGHNNDVQRIVALPGCERVVSASVDGTINIYSSVTGELVHALVARPGRCGPGGLAALGHDVFASAGSGDGNISTWGAGAGERLCTINADGGCGVSTIVGNGDWGFVAGTKGGDLLFYSHREGRDITEVDRVASAHAACVSDLAVCGNRLVAASYDRVATVWDLNTRKCLAALVGSSSAILCVSISEWYIVTGSHGKTIRVYSAVDFKLQSVFNGLHENSVWMVQLIGDDHILSASADQTLCLTNLTIVNGSLVSRTYMSFGILCVAVLGDGRVAVCGYNGNASLIKASDAATEVLAAYAGARRPPQLQAALANVLVGQAVAADACRNLITATSCSASMSEWKAAHELLILSARDGDQATEANLDVKRNWWLLTLYTLALALSDDDPAKNQPPIAAAAASEPAAEPATDPAADPKLARTYASLAFISARKDVVEGAAALRKAGDEIRRATARHRGSGADARPATQDALLSGLREAHAAHTRAPSDAHLASMFLHLVLIVSGAAGRGYTHALALLHRFVAAPTSCEFAPTSSLARAALRDAVLMLSRVSLGSFSAAEQARLETALTALAMPDIPTLRRLFCIAAPPSASAGRQTGAEAMTIAAAAAIIEDVRSRAVADASLKAEQKKKADAASPPRPGSPITPTGENATDVASATDAGWYGVMASQSPRERIAALKKEGVSQAAVGGLSRAALASCVAAFMVCYDSAAGGRLVALESCLGRVFAAEDIAGPVLVGLANVDAEEFCAAVVAGLEMDSACAASLGYKVRLRAFMAALE